MIAAAEHELVLERILDATPDKIFKAWTLPELMKQHEEMGFHERWGQVADQLNALVQGM